MPNEHLVRLFRHNRWANATLMAACVDLTPEQLDASVEGTYGQLGRTLAHLASAEVGYAWRFDQQPERFTWDDEGDVVPPVATLAMELDRAGVEVSGPQKHAYPWVPVGRKNLHGKLDSFIYEGIRHFIDCVADDRTPAATVEDGLVNTATIATALRSIEEGRPLPIELPVAAEARG